MDIRLSAVANDQLNALPKDTRRRLVNGIISLLPNLATASKRITIDELEGEVRVLAVPGAHSSVIYRLTEPERAIILSILEREDLPAPRRETFHLGDEAGASVKIGHQVLSQLE